MNACYEDTEPSWKGSHQQNLGQFEYQIVKDNSELQTTKKQKLMNLL